jgi:cytochrome c-type biogenesis protein
VRTPLFYPFTLGMLAAVNPCGFPLLPGYLDLFVGRSNRGAGGPSDSLGAGRLSGRAMRAVTAGAFCTAGFVAVFGLLGLFADLGWSSFGDRSSGAARYLMVALGVAMVVVGGATLLGRPLRVRVPRVPSGLGLRRPAALTVFGLSYAVASIGCALPLFVAGVATSFTRDNPVQGTAVLIAYALGMGVVLSGLAVAIAVGGPSAGRPLRRLSRHAPIIGSVLVIAVGLYLAAYWLVAIVHPSSSSPAERWVNSVQSHVAGVIDSHPLVIASILGAVVVMAVVAGALFAQVPRSRARDDALRSGLPAPETTAG